jgi:hypothetical protein
LKTAASVFAQRAAEQTFGLIMFDIIIASAPAPAVGLAQFFPAVS